MIALLDVDYAVFLMKIMARFTRCRMQIMNFDNNLQLCSTLNNNDSFSRCRLCSILNEDYG